MSTSSCSSSTSNVLADLLDAHRADHVQAAGVVGPRIGLLRLLFDLADHLLEQILDAHQPGGAAVLVEDDGELGVLAPHGGEHHIDARGLGNVGHGTHRVPLGFGFLREHAQDVLDVEDADDVIQVFAIHGVVGVREETRSPYYVSFPLALRWRSRTTCTRAAPSPHRP